jgi:L-lysine 2,3-aminomutase
MAHFSHPAELSTPVVKEAIRRLRATGIQIRCQAPLINHINNDSKVWTDMW